MILSCLILLTTMPLGAIEEELEVSERRLPPCPTSTNCGSTLDDLEKHAIASYRYRKSLIEAIAVLKQVFSDLSRTELVKEEEAYLHYEARSFPVPLCG